MRDERNKSWESGERGKQRDWESGERSKERDWQGQEWEKRRGWESNERREGQDWRTSEREAGQDWQSGENVRDREWREGESKKDRDWRSGESERDRAWREAEAGRGRQHETSEREAGQEWRSGESDLERQWRSWNEEANRNARKDLEEGRQGWQSGENRLGREHENEMQGNMFKQQEKMARLNAELRGYTTAGAGYGLNAAGGSVTVNNYPPGAGNPATTSGSNPNGKQGLGYGAPRATAKMSMNSGSNTSYGTGSGSSIRMTGSSTPIQPMEFRSTGSARGGLDSPADQWLNRNLISAKMGRTPMSTGIKPASNFTTASGPGVTRGTSMMGKSAANMAMGPIGMIAAIGQKGKEINQQLGRGLGMMIR